MTCQKIKNLFDGNVGSYFPDVKEHLISCEDCKLWLAIELVTSDYNDDDSFSTDFDDEKKIIFCEDNRIVLEGSTFSVAAGVKRKISPIYLPKDFSDRGALVFEKRDNDIFAFFKDLSPDVRLKISAKLFVDGQLYIVINGFDPKIKISDDDFFEIDLIKIIMESKA